MAAGQGFKNFSTGDVLTASDVNGYLMQGIWVFANATARDAAVTSPQEGNSCYLKDTDVIQVYSGSSWIVKSGGSPLTTKGDVYTYSTTDARLAVGANGTVLTADSAEATGLKWVTPTSGGMTLLETMTISAVSSATSASISSAYKDVKIYIKNYRPSNNGQDLMCRINSDSNARYNWDVAGNGTGLSTSQTGFKINGNQSSSTFNGLSVLYIDDYASTHPRVIRQTTVGNDSTTPSTVWQVSNNIGFYNQTTAVSTITFYVASGNITSATVQIYGVK